MKKIAIITWNTYHNFGTFLQAYALQQYLYALGYENKILDDHIIIGNNVNWKFKIKKILWALSRKSYRIYARSSYNSDKLFDNFKKEYLNTDNNIMPLIDLDKKYDIFICGSDQIWNPFLLENPKQTFYYAAFSKKKKIAYAPSIGVSDIPSQYKEKVRTLISSFCNLSLREDQGVESISKIVPKEVIKVVDPTLLLSREEWEKILPKNTNTEKYVLGYFLTPNTLYINATIAYAKRKSLKFKLFFTDESYLKYDCDLISAGPIEFLNNIKYAEFLFTDSFHGSIFAKIFHIQFFTLKRFGNIEKGQDSRVENLLDLFGLRYRLIENENIKDLVDSPNIDFEKVDYNVSRYINESKKYLKGGLKEL